MTPKRSSQRGKKGANDEDFVTWEVLQEALGQQKSFYEQMLDRVESSYKSFTKIVIDSANTRIDGLVREVQDLRTSLQFSQKEVDELKLTKLQTVDTSQKQVVPQSDLLAKVDYLDNQSRRNNIIIEGLGPDSASETWADTESKVREMFQNKLKLDCKTIEIERAHRNGRFSQTEDKPGPRPVVVKLLRFKDRDLILSKARAHLKETNIYINEDFSDLVRKKRADLIPAMKAARAKGNYAIISYDRLVIKPKFKTSD